MKRKNYKKIKELILVILILAFVAFLVFVNLKFVNNRDGGSDFLPYWISSRNFIQDGINPYSSENIASIRRSANELLKSEDHVLADQKYPLFTVFLFVPLSFIEDFNIALAIWMTILEVSIILSTMLIWRLLQIKTGILMMLLWLAFSIFWYYGARTIVSGNLIGLTILLISLVLYGLIKKLDELAGITLAVSFIQPQVIPVFVIFILFWAVSNRRLKIIFWFFGTLIMLVLFSFLILPTWMKDLLRLIVIDPFYNSAGTFKTFLASLMPGIGSRVGEIGSILFTLLLVIEWIIGRKSRDEKLIWLASLTLVAGQLIGLSSSPDYFVIMMPALMVIYFAMTDRWKNNNFLFSILIIVVMFIIPWIIHFRVQSGESRQEAALFLAAPALLIPGLYWIRWWIRNPVNKLSGLS